MRPIGRFFGGVVDERGEERRRRLRDPGWGWRRMSGSRDPHPKQGFVERKIHTVVGAT